MRCTDSTTGQSSYLDWIPIMSKHFFRIVALAALATAAGTAFAQDHRLGQHPAVLVQHQAAHIDPNTFIVGHPAGLAWVAAPSMTYDHPAVIVARMARQEREAAQTALVARSEAAMAQ